MPHIHTFDPVSGWCGRCGLRDDGRLIDRAGMVLREGPDYSPEDLAKMLTPTPERIQE
jgi:hypothetical protein